METLSDLIFICPLLLIAGIIDGNSGGGAIGVISHHKSAKRPNWGKIKITLKMIVEANAEGLNYVILSGEIVVQDAVFNGKKKGKIIPRNE